MKNYLKNFREIEPTHRQKTIEFQKMFDIFEQIEEVIKTYWANDSELFESEYLNEVLHGYQAA